MMNVHRRALLVCVIAGLVSSASAAQTTFRFDCGPRDQKLAEGYVALSGKDVYNAQRGYGFLKSWGVDAGGREHADLRYVDSITARDSADKSPEDNNVTFRVDLPNGVYAVTVWLGDPSPREGRKGMCAAINGKVVLPEPGVGGWGLVTERKLPAVVEQGTLDLNLYVTGTGGSARLALLAITVEAPADDAAGAALRKQWEQSPAKDAAARKIIVGDQELTEAGRRGEPDRAAIPHDWPVRDLLTFSRSSPGEILGYSVPRETEITRQLEGFACPGEDTMFWLGVHALREVNDVRASCSDLIGSDGYIPAHQTTLHTLTTRPRALSDRSGNVAKLVCDLMEQDIPFV
ncbi:MAG: hypothetical protein IT440_06375 [Phycisphaeraceae bacterium]|nr:hypothetical protein [Phycisphaeraceae bacterium]